MEAAIKGNFRAIKAKRHQRHGKGIKGQPRQETAARRGH